MQPHPFLFISDVGKLNDVHGLLTGFHFDETRWFQLGLKLGLSENTLRIIECNSCHDTSRCLIECISKWLRRADNVDNKGGATLDSLSGALRSMNEIAVADKLITYSKLL